jgi:Ca2+-binding RTX toxin-like protein
VKGAHRYLAISLGIGLFFVLATGSGAGPIESEMCGTRVATIVGTDNPEALTGTVGDDVIVGKGGDDTIVGLAGNDALCGGDGNDTIDGGEGDDNVDGDDPAGLLPGIDTIEGGPGGDFIEGGPGDDVINGGDGFDNLSFFYAAQPGVTVDLKAGTATGGAGADRISGFEAALGSAWNDVMTGTDDDLNIFTGREGDDQVHAAGGLDLVLFSRPVRADLASGRSDTLVFGPGTEGADTFEGVEGLAASDGSTLIGDNGDNLLLWASILIGRGGNDKLLGNEGTEIMDGGPGDDSLRGGTGDDVLDGGSGVDTASYLEAPGDTPVKVTVNLAKHGADGLGHDTLRQIESVIGSTLNDVILGDEKPNLLYGNAGDDTVLGLAGDDYLAGGSGINTLGGGKGIDYCVDGIKRSSCEHSESSQALISTAARSRDSAHARSLTPAPEIAGQLAQALAAMGGATCSSRDCARVIARLASTSVAVGGTSLSARTAPDRSRVAVVIGDNVVPQPAVCSATGGRYVTWIKPPDAIRPQASSGETEWVEWHATLRRISGKGGQRDVLSTTIARAQIAGPGFPHPGDPWWETEASGEKYPAPVRYPIQRGSVYRWMGTVTWEDGPTVPVKVPHRIEPGGGYGRPCGFSR